MQEVLRKLEEVQELDSQIGNLLAKKAEFPKRLVGYELDISTNSTKHADKKKVVDELEKGKRQQLGALELNDERTKRSQEKLEQIKTNQEYQAILKEIESLKKNSAVIKESADKVEAELVKHRAELATFETAWKEAQGKHDVESAKIAEESKSFDADLSKLQDKRKSAIVGIEPRYLAAYDRARMSRQGVGIVGAVGGSCRGCNMRIPPQIYNELQRGTELHMCPSCKRILVYKDNVSKGSPQSANL